MAGFEVGHRVMVTNWQGTADEGGMNGYYGHVVKVEPLDDDADGPVVLVSLKGRVAALARTHDLDPNGDRPWIFFAVELQHAD